MTRIAKGFGMKISALDKFVDDAVMEAEGVRPVHDVDALVECMHEFESLH